MSIVNQQIIDGFDESFYQKLMQIFYSQTIDSIGKIEQAVQLSDAPTIYFHAHKIKGSADTVGAVRLAKLASLIEIKAKSDDILRSEIKTLQASLDEFKTYIDTITTP